MPKRPSSVVRDAIERDVDDELRGHIELRARDLELEGLSPEKAGAQALELFGRAADVESECVRIQGRMERRRRLTVRMDDLFTDLLWGARGLRRAPGFTLFASLTLALGIAANTAIFSVVNGLFFRDTPGVTAPEDLVEISRGPGYVSVSYPMYEHFRDNASFLEGLAAFDLLGLAVGNEDGPEVVMGLQVSGNYFDVLGTRPSLGRFFSSEESTVPPNDLVVVLAYAFWARRFDADPGVVGSTIVLNGRPVTVIGVTEEGFAGHAVAIETSAFVPLGSPIPAVHQVALGNVWSAVLELVGRVRPGTRNDALSSQLSQLGTARVLQEGNPDATSYMARAQAYAPVPGSLRGPTSLFFVVLSVLVGLLLLISCINVANLLLSRSASRRQEIAVRMSLGAGRGRLVRQMLTESVLLALLAGGLGTVLAYWGTSLLSNFQLPVAPIPGLRLDLHLAPDAFVLGYSVALAAATGVVFGLVPALRATRIDLVTDLRDGPGSNEKGGSRLQALLVGGQVAVTIVLLSGAGLFLRAVLAVETLDPGFATQDIHVATFDLELAGRRDADSWRFYEELAEAATAVPGVEMATVAGKLPLAGLSQMSPVNFEGVESPERVGGFVLANQSVGPGYFEVLNIAVIAGRGVAGTDQADSPPVVVVNQTLADRFWPDESALGRHVTTYSRDGAPVEWEVVGVVETAKYRRLNEEPRAFAYFPASQRPRTDMVLHLKMAPGMAPPLREIRATATRLEPAAAMLSAGSLESVIGIFMLPQRIGAWVGGVIGSLGLLLGGVGVYGISAYRVARRARDVGVRMALGADTGTIIVEVLKNGMKAPVIGAGVGLAIAFGTSRFLEAFLFGVSPLDPTTFVGVIGVLGGMAFLANLIPALRAAGVDPARVLRSE
jgi:predicted permease